MSEKRKRKRTIKSPPKARPKRQAEIREAVAKLPPKRKQPKLRHKKSFGQKVRAFFFPKHFKDEMYRGMEMSSPYGCTAVLIPILMGVGRLVRKIVDPRHKMFGQGGKDNEKTSS